MSQSLHFKLTQRGQQALWNADHTGLALMLTHLQCGSGNQRPSGQETALRQPEQSAPIAAGCAVADHQIRMSAIFSGPQKYLVNEIGLWAGVPDAPDAVLVAYWSQEAGSITVKSAGVDLVISHDMVLDASVPEGRLSILADQAQSTMLAMIMAHEGKADPHPQYVRRDQFDGLLRPSLLAHEADDHAHRQYVRSDLSNLREGSITPSLLSAGAPAWRADGRLVIGSGRVLGARFASRGGKLISFHRLATLPPGGADPLDMLRITGVYGSAIASQFAGKHPLEIIISNRGGMNIKFLRGAISLPEIGIRIHQTSDQALVVYLRMEGSTTACFDMDGTGLVLHADTPLVSEPEGQRVWDSSTELPESYFQAGGRLMVPGGIAGIHPGEVAFFASNSAPEGFLKANGAAVSRAAYTLLFNVIGITFGAGDRSTTFNLPDLRGEFLRAYDDGRGSDPGRQLGSWQADALRAHSHATLQMIYDNSIDGVDSVTRWSGEHHNEWRETALTGSTETRPRNVALLACIRY